MRGDAELMQKPIAYYKNKRLSVFLLVQSRAVWYNIGSSGVGIAVLSAIMLQSHIN